MREGDVGLLADLRALQRRFGLALLLVHHTRKGNGPVAGHALRGSSDLHAWGDSSLYLKKAKHQIRLSIEHRAARAPESITLALTGEPAHLEITASEARAAETDLREQVLRALHRHPAPMTQAQLRLTLKVRNQTLTATLRDLLAKKMKRFFDAWQIARCVWRASSWGLAYLSALVPGLGSIRRIQLKLDSTPCAIPAIIIGHCRLTTIQAFLS